MLGQLKDMTTDRRGRTIGLSHSLPGLTMTLEQFLKDGMAAGNIDFRVRCTTDEFGLLKILVHPLDKDGATKDFVVVDNEIGDPDEPDFDVDDDDPEVTGY